MGVLCGIKFRSILEESDKDVLCGVGYPTKTCIDVFLVGRCWDMVRRTHDGDDVAHCLGSRAWI